jgi:hypothetical protein
MLDSLPAEVLVTDEPSGIRYRLPRPQLGPLRWGGLFVAFIGLMPIGMAIGFASFALHAFGDNPFRLLILLCPLPVLLAFVAVGLAILFVGAWLFAGKVEIQLTPTHVRAIRLVGPFWWSWRCRRDQVRQFTMVRAGAARTSPVDNNPWGAWNTLLAERKGKKPMTLAFGHPHDLLLAVAHDLSRRVTPPPSEYADVLPAEPVEVSLESGDPAVVQERPRQPADSTAVLETFPDGITLTLRPVGIWRGADRFFTLFTFLWCGMVVLITLGLIVGAITGGLHDEDGHPVNPVYGGLFLIPFWATGIGCLLAVLHFGRRGTVLAVTGDRLMVLQTGLFGTRQQEWARSQLIAVRVLVTSRSDGEGGTTWTNQLAIEPNDGPTVQLLSYRPKRELEWMATVLRRALQMGEVEAKGSAG